MSDNQAEEVAIGRSGANGLLAVAVIELISATVMFFVIGEATPEPIELGVAYGLVAAFFGLYLWARQNPYPALCVGLGLFLLLHGLVALVDPATIVQGILIKIIVISVLVGAIRNLRAHRQFRRMAL